MLRELDVVIAAVHGSSTCPRERQTARILKALDHPLVTMLAHPLGRLIDRARALRRGHAEDHPQGGARAGASWKLNAHPERLDLFDTHCRMAKDEGVLGQRQFGRAQRSSSSTTSSTASARRAGAGSRRATC